MTTEERKVYMREYLKVYTVANRARINEHKAKYRAKNQTNLNASSKRYVKANKEKRAATTKKYRQSHPATTRVFTEAQKARIRERSRERHAENPEKYRTTYHNSRAKRRMAEGRHTTKEWLAVKAAQSNECAICHLVCKLERDHIVALSLGGSNFISNIQGLCRSCNARKGVLERDNDKTVFGRENRGPVIPRRTP